MTPYAEWLPPSLASYPRGRQRIIPEGVGVRGMTGTTVADGYHREPDDCDVETRCIQFPGQSLLNREKVGPVDLSLDTKELACLTRALAAADCG